MFYLSLDQKLNFKLIVKPTTHVAGLTTGHSVPHLKGLQNETK